MKLRYSYHSEHNADAQDRWSHFLLFLGALIAFAAAVQRLFHYFTDWSGEENSSNWGALALGIMYLIAGVCLIILGLRALRASRGVADRYVRVDDTHLRWHLLQTEEEQSVALANLEGVERRSVRELVLRLRGGEEVVFPIYLVANEEKQRELVSVLSTKV